MYHLEKERSSNTPPIKSSDFKETLQLFHYTTTSKSCLPVIQNIQSCCIIDTQATLFLTSIQEDPMLLDGLRKSKSGFEKERAGIVDNYIRTSSKIYTE